MADTPASLTDLPLDIILLITPYLDVRSFLRLCSTCTALQEPTVRSDAAYWNNVTRKTFRVPNQPVVQADGRRWERLYKRMLTQSRVYTWGSNKHQCLGHRDERAHTLRIPRHRQPRLHRNFPNSHVPEEMDRTRDLGVIADLQCGGWSTTLLTADGQLHAAGVLNGLAIVLRSPDRGLQRLTFPPGYLQEDPSVTIKQFSSGRSHVLGLSDSGRIWSWDDEAKPAWHVTFVHVDISESHNAVTLESKPSTVRKVVAGWSVSSAYISGTGILLWRPPLHTRSDVSMEANAEVFESIIVPFTDYQRPQRNAREPDESTQNLGEEVGAVVNYIVLEHFVVFVTDIGKFFAARMTWEAEVGSVSDVIELASLRANATQGKNAKIDVQGSFSSFAALKDGEVITSTQEYLEECWNARQLNGLNLGVENSEGLRRIPALQQSGVISVAFGDYHLHALHSSGHITSYGREPQRCGCLGLGSFSHLRGVRVTGVGGDGALVRHAYTSGRRIWFENVKQRWFVFMASGGRDPDEAAERIRMASTDYNAQGEISEWFEQESKLWDQLPEARDEDGLGAYFALSITAAGWHSGALVLANEDLAQKMHDRCIIEAEPKENTPTQATEITRDPQDHQDDRTAVMTQGMLQWAYAWVCGWTNWFLGLPDNTDASTSHDRTQAPQPQPQARPPAPTQPLPMSQGTHAPPSSELRSGGASSPERTKHVESWVNDSFPRLRLSDGREMPGEVEFSDWWGGEPEWDLSFEP